MYLFLLVYTLQKSIDYEVIFCVCIWLLLNKTSNIVIPTLYLWINSCSNFITFDIKVIQTKGIENKWHKIMRSLDFEDAWNWRFSIINFTSYIWTIKIEFAFTWQNVNLILDVMCHENQKLFMCNKKMKET